MTWDAERLPDPPNRDASFATPDPERPVIDPRLADMLRVLDPPRGKRPWHGGAGPLGSLRGVGPTEAAWKPAPDRHSVWELVLHIAYWKYAVCRRILGGPVGGFPRSPADWPKMPKTINDKSWKADRDLLRHEHDRFVGLVREFDPAKLDDSSPTGEWSYGDLILGVVTHDAYHTGQIQLMKRLWRAMKPGK